MSPDLDIANISSDDDLKVGALADGLATSAINSTEVDDGAVGLVGVANESNSNNSNVTDNDSIGNGNNRDNELNTNSNNEDSHDVDSKIFSATHTDTDVDIKDNGNISNSNNSYDWTSNKTDTDVKTFTSTDTRNVTHTEANDNGDNSHNYTDSSQYTKTDSDYDFGTIKDVEDVGNLGVAGHDLTFNLGDDFSFNLNIDHILDNSLNNGSNNSGFSLVQANNLADQDYAYNTSMNNAHAHNDLTSDGGEAYGAQGIGFDTKLNLDPDPGAFSASHNMTGNSTADASSILANSGYHQELVQGANMVSNSSDLSFTGGSDHHDVNS